VQQVETRGGDDVEHDRDDRDRREWTFDVAARRRLVQGRPIQQRDGGPGQQHGADRRAEHDEHAHRATGARGREVQTGGDGEDRGEREADRLCEVEAGVGVRDDDPGRRQRVQGQESGAGQEGE
jgi:hypothetical protein